ncbi:MAG: hypothetical protein A2927_01070 [Candidatus Komeilibacteria bacterium RIFCSPLOWO2_01_FULL_45_10]|uniref:Thymidylate kinase n=1 Tax=Candidatus Komeilibacteria bacterium RIFCSPLOWO2_01_FULL_45_10 TaxID=1798550 RepID=A0A1G2BMX2_9BACT|nr:MAG: hypothetical protein A2927_01070 [Candidatus Komeilibacteria bacterium RIFCSPLOWO2_01_FULL_45_10]
MKGKLIVFEGIDGVGKTTLSLTFKKELAKRGIPAIHYEKEAEDENGGYNKLKPFIKNNTPSSASLFFYLSSSIFKSGIINELLKSKWVICDRYIYSTLAYHKIRGANYQNFFKLNNLPIVWPDFYFLIKTNEKVRLARIERRKTSLKDDFKRKKRGSLVDRMEKELVRFHPHIINNNSDDIGKTVARIIHLVFRDV